jgi:hypothetical protein
MATHAGDDYYVFTSTGTIQAQSDPVLALALKASGWIGPYTYAVAEQKIGQGTTVGQIAGSVTSDFAAVNKFLGQLGDKAVWVRVAEVIIGLALIIVGLDKALAGTPGGSAAHAVAKGAFLA